MAVLVVSGKRLFDLHLITHGQTEAVEVAAEAAAEAAAFVAAVIMALLLTPKKVIIIIIF